MIQNYFQTISELRQLKSSQARVYSIFRCLFCRIWVIFLSLTVKLFFSGPRIRIIAEDNANAEELELNFGTKKTVGKCQRKIKYLLDK